MIKPETKSYYTVEPALQRFLVRTFEELQPRRCTEFINLIDISAHASSLADLEVPQLLHILLKTHGGSRNTVLLFGQYPISPYFPGDARFVQAIRNRHSHETRISAEEHVSDLVIIQRFVQTLMKVRTSLTDDDHALNELLTRQLANYRARAAEVHELQLPDTDNALQGMVDEMRRRLDDLGSRVALMESGLHDIRAHVLATPDQTPRANEYTLIDGQIASIHMRVEGQVSQLTNLSERLSALQATSQVLHEQHQLLLSRLAVVATQSKQTLAQATDADLIGNFQIQAENSLPNIGDDPPAMMHAEADAEADTVDDLEEAFTLEEARDRLIGLRWQIWDELGVGPSEDGLLRKRMIDHFIRERITTEEALYRKVPAKEWSRIDPVQLVYLPDVFAIIERMGD